MDPRTFLKHHAKKRTRRVSWAKAAQPNTPETDAMPMVLHLVGFSDGTEMTLMATDPSDAIARAREHEIFEAQELVNRLLDVRGSCGR
jgi:hypothetical protein